MMTTQILKFVNSTKTQKSNYLENETFSLLTKKIIHDVLSIIWQRKGEVTFSKVLK